MSLFSPLYTTSSDASDPSFTPLFRLLSDWDDYSREVAPSGRRGTRHSQMRSFVPKFDYRETEQGYELHGELPGINKENIHIDFTDNQTIIVKGKVERSYEAGTPPAGWVTGPSASGAITEGGEKPHKATVEDAGDDGEGSATQSTGQGEVAKKEEKKGPANNAKYWVSERSVGEFSRAFQFPTPVDTEGVTASLKDGILSIGVPKARKPASRRITVQ